MGTTQKSWVDAGVQQPQAGNRQYARVQRVPSTERGISPPSSKGDGWGVGRGRQVFCPVTFPCPPQPQSDLHPIFHYQTIQGIYQRDQQSPSRKGVLESIYSIGIVESHILD